MAIAQGPAELIPTDVRVLVDAAEPGATRLAPMGTSPVSPRCVIRFVDLYLVLDSDDGFWYMGAATDSGAIHCWAGYGEDLEDAIRAL